MGPSSPRFLHFFAKMCPQTCPFPAQTKPTTLALDICNLSTISPKFNKDDRLGAGGEGRGGAIQLISNLTFH